MRISRFIKWLLLPAGALSVAVYCVIPRETPAARGKEAPSERVERKPLRTQAAELAALPAAERESALEKLLRGGHRITAADAEYFLQMRSKARAEGVTTAQWHQLLERWASTHPQEAAEFLEKRGMLMGLLMDLAPDALPVLKTWARGDATSILDWVKAGGDERKAWWNRSRDIFAHAWVKHNPAAARAWVDAGGNDGMESSIVSGVFQSAAPETIAAWLMRHSASDAKISPAARNTAVHLLAQQHLNQGGAEAALAWAETLPRPDELTSATKAILTSLTASAPEKSVAWLAKQPARGQNTAWQAIEAMSKWADGDPIAAGEWLNAHRDSPAAPAFVEAYAASIAGDDPAAARQWIAQLPETPVPQTNESGWIPADAPPSRAALEHLVSLAEISAIALDDPARAVALAGALPGNAVAGLMNYRISLVREAPGEPPVPRFTPVCPDV